MILGKFLVAGTIVNIYSEDLLQGLRMSWEIFSTTCCKRIWLVLFASQLKFLSTQGASAI